MFEGQYYFGFVVFTLKAKIFGHSWRPKILTSDIFWHPKFVMCEIFCKTWYFLCLKCVFSCLHVFYI